MPFLEYEQLDNLLEVVFKIKKMKIVKFGGKSLANGEGINTVVNIIEGKIKQEKKIAIVVSARGKATDELDDILTIAAKMEITNHF
jgi:aspartokinase